MLNEKSSIITAVLITLLICLIGGGIGMYFIAQKYQRDITDLQVESDNLKKSSTSTSNGNELDTSNWATYTNTEYGYSFKYPTGYGILDQCYNMQTEKLQDFKDKKSLVVVDKNKISEKAIPCESDYVQQFFTVFGAKSPIDLTDAKNVTEDNMVVSDKTIDSEKGVLRISKKPTMLDDSYYSEILVNHNNTGITINWENTDVKGTHDSIIDRIVETFKFSE